MDQHSIADDFGRVTKFEGEQLIDESTDNYSGVKPQWLEFTVWRTAAGAFIVRRVTRYRINHLSDSCPRLDGFVVVDAEPTDTYPCGTCNKAGAFGDGWAQSARVVVEVYSSPEELISSLKVDGRYSNLSRSILADLSAVDERVRALWSEVVVP